MYLCIHVKVHGELIKPTNYKDSTMNLSANNFSKTSLTKRFTFKDKSWDTPYSRFTYETHNAIYDVDVRESDGDKTYRKNCGFDTDPSPIHHAIEKHFSL